MSFWTFGKKLYLFGGYNEQNRKDTLVKGPVLRIDLVGNNKVQPIKIKGLEPRYYHTTSVIKESSNSQTILILGGDNEENVTDNASLVFQMTKMNMYHLLHFFDATGVWWLLGTN